jgi:hypothetical protein
VFHAAQVPHLMNYASAIPLQSFHNWPVSVTFFGQFCKICCWVGPIVHMPARLYNRVLMCHRMWVEDLWECLARAWWCLEAINISKFIGMDSDRNTYIGCRGNNNYDGVSMREVWWTNWIVVVYGSRNKCSPITFRAIAIDNPIVHATAKWSPCILCRHYYRQGDLYFGEIA